MGCQEEGPAVRTAALGVLLAEYTADISMKTTGISMGTGSLLL